MDVCCVAMPRHIFPNGPILPARLGTIEQLDVLGALARQSRLFAVHQDAVPCSKIAFVTEPDIVVEVLALGFQLPIDHIASHIRITEHVEW